jgi:hypothetical protein
MGPIMKKRTLVIVFVLVLAGLGQTAFGAGVSVTLKAGYFFPSSSLFRDVYKSGPTFGGEVTVPLAGALRIWAGADLFGKTGLLSVTEETTKVRVIPVYAGLRAEFGKKGVRPYLGAAAAYFLFHEENPLGTISDSGLGFLARAGLLARLGGPMWLDFFADYRSCTLRTDGDDPLEAKLDGLSAGAGLSFRF